MIEFFEERARALVKEAKENGIRMTIEAVPRQPLAMGNIDYAIDVRDDLATFRSGGRPAPREVWLWWYDGDDRCHCADSEAEAHGEAISDIERDYSPGESCEYLVGRGIAPVDFLARMKWLGQDVLERLEERASEETCAEDAVLSFTKQDEEDLARLLVEFVRARGKTRHWTADDKSATKHTHTVPYEVDHKKPDDTKGGSID